MHEQLCPWCSLKTDRMLYKSNFEEIPNNRDITPVTTFYEHKLNYEDTKILKLYKRIKKSFVHQQCLDIDIIYFMMIVTVIYGTGNICLQRNVIKSHNNNSGGVLIITLSQQPELLHSLLLCQKLSGDTWAPDMHKCQFYLSIISTNTHQPTLIQYILSKNFYKILHVNWGRRSQFHLSIWSILIKVFRTVWMNLSWTLHSLFSCYTIEKWGPPSSSNRFTNKIMCILFRHHQMLKIMKFYQKEEREMVSIH